MSRQLEPTESILFLKEYFDCPELRYYGLSKDDAYSTLLNPRLDTLQDIRQYIMDIFFLDECLTDVQYERLYYIVYEALTTLQLQAIEQSDEVVSNENVSNERVLNESVKKARDLINKNRRWSKTSWQSVLEGVLICLHQLK